MKSPNKHLTLVSSKRNETFDLSPKKANSLKGNHLKVMNKSMKYMNSCKTFNKLLDSFIACTKETLSASNVLVIICDYSIKEHLVSENRGKVQSMRINNKQVFQYIDYK